MPTISTGLVAQAANITQCSRDHISDSQSIDSSKVCDETTIAPIAKPLGALSRLPFEILTIALLYCPEKTLGLFSQVNHFAYEKVISVRLALFQPYSETVGKWLKEALFSDEGKKELNKNLILKNLVKDTLSGKVIRGNVGKIIEWILFSKHELTRQKLTEMGLLESTQTSAVAASSEEAAIGSADYVQYLSPQHTTHFYLSINILCTQEPEADLNIWFDISPDNMGRKLLQKFCYRPLDDAQLSDLEKIDLEKIFQSKAFLNDGRYKHPFHFYPVIEAVLHRNKLSLERLLQEGFNVNSRNYAGKSALYLALTESYDADIARLLIDKGAIIDWSDQSLWGALLHVAASNGDIEMFKRVRRLGVNIDWVSVQGELPLHLAVRNNQFNMVKYLCENENGIAINSVTIKSPNRLLSEEGVTALHIAAEKGFTDIAEYLIDNGADLESQCCSIFGDKYNSLIFAIENGHFTTVRLLVERGANVNAEVRFLNSPRELALQINRHDIAAYLLEHGADPYPGITRLPAAIKIPIYAFLYGWAFCRLSITFFFAYIKMAFINLAFPYTVLYRKLYS